MHVSRIGRHSDRRARWIVAALLGFALTLSAATAQTGDTVDDGPASSPTADRLRTILGTESLPPDLYLDPDVLKPLINLETESRIANLPVRQHPVNEGLFETGCARCHRLTGPLANDEGAPDDVFDVLAPEPTTEPPPSGFAQLTSDSAREELPRWSPDGRRILYERRGEDGRWGLWIVQADGSESRPIVTHGNAGWGEWSPDGRRVAFWAEDEAGRGNVWIVEADGGEPRQLTQAEAAAFPVWSPDGRRIAYQAKGPDGGWSLELLDPETGTSRRLNPRDQVMPSRPQFSPDGSRIAYQVADMGQFGLWRLEFPDTSEGTPDYGAIPRSIPGSTLLPMDIGAAPNNGIWSPDGTRLALQMISLTTTPRGDLRLAYKTWLTNPDGSLATLLTPTATYADRSPSWSPSGRWLVQWSWNHDLRASVWLASPDPNTPPIDLADGFGADAMYPSWSPDGTKIAFSGNRGGSFDIWVLDVRTVAPGFTP